MPNLKLIQYVERFSTPESANQAANAIKDMHGLIGVRVARSPSYNEPDWLLQAFFEVEDFVNPEAIASCYGMRIVSVTPTMLVRLLQEQGGL